jgi:hypothetical protein
MAMNISRREGSMVLNRWFVLSAAACTFLFIPPPNSFLSGQEWIRASKAGRMETVRSLLSSDPGGFDVPDETGYTPLRWAAIRGEGQVAKLLLEAGAHPNSVGADGGTPLHGAAHHDDPAMMTALLEAGGDVTIQNRWGRTPLHVAARRGCLQVAALLLEAGADPNATTVEGWTPLGVANRGGHPEMAELLERRGADPGQADQDGLLPGDVVLERGEPTSLSRRILDEYVGEYDLGGGFGFRVWRIGDAMHLREFAPDEMVPMAVDTFVTVQEPWRVVFLRNEEGAVSGIEVDFLRRTVSARKVVDTSGGFEYVGTRACLGCHQDGPGSGPAGMWIASRHSRAIHTLSSDQARGLAASREEYRDITDPSRAEGCVMCHMTAAQNPQARWREGAQGFNEGVGCEACHGPGSAYMAPEIMADREAFLANGGRIPDRLTCRGCHRDEAFSFSIRWERIRHGS